MKIKKQENRTFEIKFQTRDLSENSSHVISGYASVFNSPTDIYGVEETIESGAFAKALSENNDIRCLFNHDWSNVLGRTKSGTLKLLEDERGLNFEVELPNTTIANDLVESMKRGDISQCSIGFYPTKQIWDWDSDPVKRTILEVELYEVSIVSLPAYEDTEANLIRSKEFSEDIEIRKRIYKKIKGALNNE